MLKRRYLLAQGLDMGGMGGRPGLWIGLVVLAAASSASAQSIVSRDEATPAMTKAAACSPAAIRQAVDRQQVPQVIHCRYDDVSGPLMALHILPLPSRAYNDAESGSVVGQTPVAGTPLKTRLLLIQVSRGPKPQDQGSSSSVAASTSATSPVSAVSASSVAVATSLAASSTVSTSPSSSVASASSSSSISVSPPVDGPDPKEIAQLLWGAIVAYPLPAVIAVAVAGLLTVLGLRRRPRKPNAKSRSGGAPRVHCDLEAGPSRLVLSGPLVLGVKGDGR